jgi:transposase
MIEKQAAQPHRAVINRLKQFRRIATRYEETARAYLSMLCIAAAKLWIKTINTA